MVQVLTKLFFSRVEVTGRELIPDDCGGIFVAWHPNGLVDPALIIAESKKAVIFGAKHSLFKWPVVGLVLKQLGTVPIYRKADLAHLPDKIRQEKNQSSITALSKEVAKGGFTSLFPEGESHDDSGLKALRLGVARLYYQSRLLRPEGTKPPAILPVGLHYSRKQSYRSKALVQFYGPIELPPHLDVDSSPSDENIHERRLVELVAVVEQHLQRVTLSTESWQLHQLMDRARKIVRAERAHRAETNPGKLTLTERVLGMSRIWVGYQAALEKNPELVQRIQEKVAEYQDDLEALGLDDHHLDRPPPVVTWSLSLFTVLQATTVYLVLPPVLLVGLIVNWPVGHVIKWTAKLLAKGKMAIASTKLIAGIVIFPLAWGAIGIGVATGIVKARVLFPEYSGSPVVVATTVVLVCMFGGALNLRYRRLIRGTRRALRVHLTRLRRKAAINALRLERSELHDIIVGMGEGIDLPGEVDHDGSLRPTPG